MMTRYKIVLAPVEDHGYTVSVPDLPGCFTQGKSRKEALENAHEAIECYLEGLRQDGIDPAKIPKAQITSISVG